MANIVFGGTGANRTVTVTPAVEPDRDGDDHADGDGRHRDRDRQLRADGDAVNDLPTISDVADQTTSEDTATGALAFTVGDIETAAAGLTVTATSDNLTLVPLANIVLGGAGASRTRDGHAGREPDRDGDHHADGHRRPTRDRDRQLRADGHARSMTCRRSRDVADQTTPEDTATAALAFTVGDTETRRRR